MDGVVVMQRGLERTLQHLEVAARRTKEAIAVIGPTGEVRFVNTAWAVMHGYDDAEELIGEQIDLFHTQEQMETDVIVVIEEAKRRGQLAGPIEHLRSDGTVFGTETRVVTVKDDTAEAIGYVVFATETNQQTQIRQGDSEISTAPAQAAKKLQIEIREYRQTEASYRNRVAALEAENQKLRQKITELMTAEDKPAEPDPGLQQQLCRLEAELAATKQQLREQLAGRSQAEDQIASLEEKIENINSIILEHLSVEV